MSSILNSLDHRPYTLPEREWRMSQRWTNLLFAHWPVATEQIDRLLPRGLVVDTFDGYAWVGVVPFWMDQVYTRAFGERRIVVPGAYSFAELNLRTYVRSQETGLSGVYFFSLDASSALAVLGARTIFHLPYFFASMERRIQSNGTIEYTSRRLLTTRSVRFLAQYRGLGTIAEPSLPGTIEYFLTARYCLFTFFGGRLLVGHIHHLPWPLQQAEAEIQRNELPAAHGITLPRSPPVLHFARELEVYVWSLHRDRSVNSYNAKT